MSAALNILMISDVFFPRINGVSTSIETFAETLLDQGHKLTLIAPEYPADWSGYFEVIRIPSMRLPFDPEDRLMSKRLIRKHLPELKTRSFDLVHIQTPFIAHYAGIFLARALGIPSVVSYHTYFEAYFEKYLPWLPSGLLRHVARSYSASQCNQVNAIISPSSQMLAKLREYGANTRAEIIPTGIKLERYRRQPSRTFRQKHGIAEEDNVLLYVGRVAHEKNIPFLLDMLNEIQDQDVDARLVIAGEGPAQKSLQSRAHALGLEESVVFVGYLDRATELVDCYHSADVFVFSSETETQGLVLLEAMACDLPVVSIASMGSQDVLVDGQGCLVSTLDVNDFADRVISLLKQPELARQVRDAGRQYVAKWSQQNKGLQLIEFYRHTLQLYRKKVTSTVKEVFQE